MRAIFLYLIGFGALGYGFFEFWRDHVADQNAFVIGGTCVAVAAFIQVVADLWQRATRKK